ncbi:hypothetical protein [Bradyrhizobium sp.]|jgi:hypothetical protein|uniref:hypothetical protein n=1 Tax=Bradyrhizobium sp. TaxID=376 RepID=UPI0005A26796|nr:hypothetical protein [Bradyrhizobium sp.]MDU0954113.1 hypothetical protein [Bradyrhizobium sp.]MDU1671678.1 hypothetical protein [Bradyrhizobium sp.]MDU3128204.1 hypothetical protein [Bradyrhizobium sp.]MDU6133756.1 hypothetical protein [Bradyrhizobium sp.]MDU6463694.1 hypothetical protein [Bradyrhizobium sp.]
MPPATTAKPLSIMKVERTKKRRIMHIPQGGTRFTPGITLTKLPSFTWRNTAKSSFSPFNGEFEAASVGGLLFYSAIPIIG